jgi:hypothetical protein
MITRPTSEPSGRENRERECTMLRLLMDSIGQDRSLECRYAAY